MRVPAVLQSIRSIRANGLMRWCGRSYLVVWDRTAALGRQGSRNHVGGEGHAATLRRASPWREEQNEK